MQINSCETMTYGNMPLIYEYILIHFVPKIFIAFSVHVAFCDAMRGTDEQRATPPQTNLMSRIFCCPKKLFCIGFRHVSSIVPLRFFPFSFFPFSSLSFRSLSFLSLSFLSFSFLSLSFLSFSFLSLSFLSLSFLSLSFLSLLSLSALSVLSVSCFCSFLSFRSFNCFSFILPFYFHLVTLFNFNALLEGVV